MYWMPDVIVLGGSMILGNPSISIDEVKKILAKNPDIKGLNVTIPHKESIIALLDEKSDVVKKIGACNCIKIIENKLNGFNTDTLGFEKTLMTKLKPYHKNALILGTGGAAKGPGQGRQDSVPPEAGANPGHIFYDRDTTRFPKRVALPARPQKIWPVETKGLR